MDDGLNTKDTMQLCKGGMQECRLGLEGAQASRKCLLCEELGVLPRAASLYVTAALKLLLMNSPKGPKLILYSHKALMQGKVGANGTLGKQSSGVGEGEAAMDRTENTHTHTQGGGQRGRTKMKTTSHCRL